MKHAVGRFCFSTRRWFGLISFPCMTWKLWLEYIRARVKNIFVRTWCVVPLSRMLEAKEQLGINLPINEEAVREMAENRDPFTCAGCGSEVQTSSVEVSDISAYVIRSIRRGRCQACAMDAEFENRYYEGQIASKVGDEWLVALVVPSGIERIKARLWGGL
jgi:hypothetical protein